MRDVHKVSNRKEVLEHFSIFSKLSVLILFSTKVGAPNILANITSLHLPLLALLGQKKSKKRLKKCHYVFQFYLKFSRALNRSLLRQPMEVEDFVLQRRMFKGSVIA